MSDNVVKEVKNQLDIVQVISQHIGITKKGQNYVGICPFHSEKTPSFYVSPAKQMFHCFGCGESGDVLSFLMKYENLSFREVIIEKARELNIETSFSENQAYYNQMDLIRNSLNELYLIYVNGLKNAEKSVKEYCSQRGLNDHDINAFGLGYAETADIQKKWIDKMGDINQLKKTGLFNERLYPLLIQRLIFPIHNSRGIIIGFSGRSIGASNNAKYINSPESQMFSKKKVLYGLHKAKKKIASEKTVILVEGYMDVIFMHKHGFENTVAVMGTALTEGHASQLAKFCKHVILMFDSDQAGVNALTKSLRPLQNQLLNINIVSLEEKDPADFLNVYPANDMQKKISESKHYIDFFMDEYKTYYDLANPSKKSEYISKICAILNDEKDIVIRDAYIDKLVELTGTSKNIIGAQFGNNESGRGAKRQLLSLQTDSKYKKAQDTVLFYSISNVEFRKKFIDDIVNGVDLFSNDDLKQVFQTSDLIDQEFIFLLKDSEIRNYLLSLVIKFTEHNFEYSLKEMEEYLALLKEKKMKQRISEIKGLLGNLNQNNQSEKKLLIELSSLMKKIKRGVYVSN